MASPVRRGRDVKNGARVATRTPRWIAAGCIPLRARGVLRFSCLSATASRIGPGWIIFGRLCLKRLPHRLLVTPVLHLLGQHENVLVGASVSPRAAAEFNLAGVYIRKFWRSDLVPPPAVHALGHRIRLSPHEVLAHDPAVGLQGEGDAVGHEHEIAVLDTVVILGRGGATSVCLLLLCAPRAATAAREHIPAIEPKYPVVPQHSVDFPCPLHRALNMALGSWLQA